MKKTALTAAVMALALSTGSSLAADLPSYKAPPPPPLSPPPAWTGFYVGLNAGGTWNDNNSVSVASVPVFANPALSAFGIAEFNNITLGGNGIVPSSGGGGFIGGGQIGYNYQFNNFVVGIEADIQGIAGGGSASSVVSVLPTGFVIGGAGINSISAIAATKALDYLGTVRGRLGYLVTPSLLVFGSGGLSYGGISSSVAIFQHADVPQVDNGPTFSNGAFSDTRVGWTAGGGVEWLFWPNWSAKVEYLYYDLGNVTYSAGARLATLAPPLAPIPVWAHVSQAQTRFNGHIVRVGLNYHFNLFAMPAPIAAAF